MVSPYGYTFRSYDGSGMFNWRFLFPFKYHKAEEKIVTHKKANLFAVDLTEEKHKPLLFLQVWDADLFSSDDFIGKVVVDSTRKQFKKSQLRMKLS